MKLVSDLRKQGSNPIWTLVAVLLVSVALGLIPMFFACVVDRTTVFLSYFQTPLIAILNIVPVVVLMFVLYFILNRAWIAGLVTGLFCLILGFVNYYKITFRNEPLNFEDITLIREAGSMTTRGYDLFLNKSMIAAILLVAVAVLFLKFFATGRHRPLVRGISGVLLLFGFVFLLNTSYKNNEIYEVKTRNLEHINQWSESQVYYSKGLLYPFLHSIWTYSFPVPDNYHEPAVRQWLNELEGEAIPEDRQIDVMSIMLEAYADFETLYGYEFEGLNESVYAPLRQIQAESVSGYMVANVFAGGTINTERAFLSGLLYQPTYRGVTNAYPWYFRDNGYYTEGAHASYSWFYNRMNTNYNLGFENYYFLGDDEVGDSYFDKDFIPKLELLYREHGAESDAPYFAYHLTYQGHGPYSTETLDWGDGYLAWNDDYSDYTNTVLNNYFGSVQNTMELMLEMMENLRDYDRPLLIVAYGDHMPWLGDAAGIYYELGINIDPSTIEGYLNYYSTPYFIWANDKAKEVLGWDVAGEGGTIAPCFLMNKVFAVCGWTGPAYLQASNQVMDKVPVPTDKGVYFLADGSTTLDEPEIVTQFTALQYFYQKQFLYSHLIK